MTTITPVISSATITTSAATAGTETSETSVTAENISPDWSDSPWVKSPSVAHGVWRSALLVSERAYAEQSQRLYISLFGRFCKWLAAEKINLLNMKPLDISRFLDTLRGRGASVAANRTQRTYVAEIERVCCHLVALGLRQDNPASKTLEMLRITTPLRPRSINLGLPNTRQRYLDSLDELSTTRITRMTPVEVQRCAMNLLMIDTGITLKELQKLVLKNVEQVEDGIVTAPGHRMLLPRDMPLTEESQKWLKRWLELRANLKLLSQAQYEEMRATGLPIEKFAAKARSKRSRVFVSFTGKSGRPLGMRSSGVVLDHLFSYSIYLGAQDAILAGMDISLSERRLIRNKGPQALRNQFCANLVARELPVSEIAGLMGLRRPDQVWAMQRQLQI